MTENQVIRNRF